MFNENAKISSRHKGSKRKSAIVVHTYAHRLAAVRNALNASDNWVTIQVVGPFLVYRQAVAFFSLWNKKVRSRASKIQRGFDLLGKYHEKYNLKMWCQLRPAAEMTRNIENRKERAVIDYAKEDIQTIRDMQRRRKLK
jgi:hypothetical protein